MDGLVIQGPLLQELGEKVPNTSAEVYSSREDVLKLPGTSHDISERNVSRNDAESNRPDLKRVLQAKKRLQAFCSSKLNTYNAASTPVKNVGTPKALVINQTVIDERGNKTDMKVTVKKPPLRKGQNPGDRAKAVIKEIEEMKKQELEIARQQILTTPAAVNFDENHNGRSQRSEQDNHFKKHEIKFRNYRKSDFNVRSPSPEYRVTRKTKKKSSYPQDWDEFKNNLFDFKRIREMNNRKLDRSNRHGTYNDYTQHLILKAPSHLIEPYKMTTSSGKSISVPFQQIRFTTSSPKVPYSVNTNSIKEVYFSRNEIFRVINTDFKDILLKLYDSKNYCKSKPAKKKSTKEWFPKNWKGDNNECKLLENSIGLSFLQNYSGEDDDEDDEADDTINDTAKVNIEDNVQVDGSKSVDTDELKNLHKVEEDIKMASDSIDISTNQQNIIAKDQVEEMELFHHNTDIHKDIQEEFRDIGRKLKDDVCKPESDLQIKAESEYQTNEKEASPKLSETFSTIKGDEVEEQNKDVDYSPKKKSKVRASKRQKYESRKTEDIEKELLEIEEKLRQHKKKIKKKKKKTDKADSSDEEIIEKKTKKKKKKEKRKKYSDDDDSESETEIKEKHGKDKVKKLKNKKIKSKKTKKQSKSGETKQRENRIKKKSKHVSEEEKEISKKRKKKLRRETSTSSESSSEGDIEETKSVLRKEKRRTVKKVEDVEDIPGVEDFKLEKSQEREITPPCTKKLRRLENNSTQNKEKEETTASRHIQKKGDESKHTQSAYSRPYEYDSYDSASEYREKVVRSKVQVFQSKENTGSNFGDDPLCKKYDVDDGNTKRKSQNVCEKIKDDKIHTKKKEGQKGDSRKFNDDPEVNKDRLKLKDKLKEKDHSKERGKEKEKLHDKSKDKSKEKDKQNNDYNYGDKKTRTQKKEHLFRGHSFSSEDDLDFSKKASESRKRKLSLNDFESISPQDFEVNDNKTPDTDEYHSFWETEDEASPSVSTDRRRMNRSWESDEELFGRNTILMDSEQNTYKPQKLEMPLHLDKFTKHTRGRWDQESRSSAHYDDYRDTSTDLKILELERETLNQEKRKLEIERKKVEQLERERLRELEQERLNEMEERRLIEIERTRELDLLNKQRNREKDYRSSRRFDVKIKEERHEKDRDRRDVETSRSSQKTAGGNIDKCARKEKRTSTPLFDLTRVKTEPVDEEYSLDNSLVSGSSLDMVSEKKSRKCVTPAALENEYEEFIKAVGSDITADKPNVTQTQDSSMTKVTSTRKPVTTSNELSKPKAKSEIAKLIPPLDTPAPAAKVVPDLSKACPESVIIPPHTDINITLPENIPLPETNISNSKIAPVPVPFPKVTPCDTSLLPSGDQEWNKEVNNGLESLPSKIVENITGESPSLGEISENKNSPSVNILKYSTNEEPLPVDEIILPAEMVTPDTSNVAEEDQSQKCPFTFTAITLPSKRLLTNSVLKLIDDSDNEGLTGKMIKKLDDLSATISELKKDKPPKIKPLEKKTPCVEPKPEETKVQTQVPSPIKIEVVANEPPENPVKAAVRKRSRSRSRSPYLNRQYEKDHRKSDLHRYSPQRTIRRSPSPRRYGSPYRRSPRRRRYASPGRSPKRSRRSPSHRDKSPHGRSISPRSRRLSPLKDSTRRESPRRTGHQERSHQTDLICGRRPKSPPHSPLRGTKRSVADSTISDDLLPQPNHDEFLDSSSENKMFGRPEGYRSPKRISLDDRISQVLGINKEEVKPRLAEYHNYNYLQGYYDQYGQFVQYEVYSQQLAPKKECQNSPNLTVIPTSRVNENRKKVSSSRVVQVGNVLEVVPTEDIHPSPKLTKLQPSPKLMKLQPSPKLMKLQPSPKLMKLQPSPKLMKQDKAKSSVPKEEKKPPPQPVQKIVQVGNMLQIVPTPTPPPVLAKLPEKPKTPLPEQSVPKVPIDVAPSVPAENTAEKQTAEELMKQKIAERRAERESRRAEREKRKKEKEKKRKEKEKQRQIKLKIKTEEIIKRALLMETGDLDEDDDDPSQWPPVPIIITDQDGKEPGKSILLCDGFGKLSEESRAASTSKSVKFADGIRPGEGTSPSGGEELSSPPPMSTILPKEKRYKKTKVPKKIKKKKIKVKVIKKQPTEEEEESEEDNLAPPPPPPGSPPPHLFPPRIKTHTINNIKPSYVSEGIQLASQAPRSTTVGSSSSVQPPLPSIIPTQPPPPPTSHPPHPSTIQPPPPAPAQPPVPPNYKPSLPASSQGYMSQNQDNINVVPSRNGNLGQNMGSVARFLVQNPSLMGNTVPGSNLKMSDAMNQAIQATLNSTGGLRMLNHTLMGQVNGPSRTLHTQESSGSNITAQVANISMLNHTLMGQVNGPSRILQAQESSGSNITAQGANISMLNHTLMGQVNGPSRTLQTQESSGSNITAQVANISHDRSGSMNLSNSRNHSAGRNYNRHNDGRPHRRGNSPHNRHPSGGFGRHRRFPSHNIGRSRGHGRPGQRSRDSNFRHRKRF